MGLKPREEDIASKLSRIRMIGLSLKANKFTKFVCPDCLIEFPCPQRLFHPAHDDHTALAHRDKENIETFPINPILTQGKLLIIN